MSYPIPTVADNGKWFWYKEIRRSGECPAEVVQPRFYYCQINRGSCVTTDISRANGYVATFQYYGDLVIVAFPFESLSESSATHTVRVWGPEVVRPENF